METRTLETSSFDSAGAPLSGIRWAAVFAGLAVGLGVQLLLMLIGVAFGFAVYGAGGRPEGASLSVAAATWNTISLLIAALIGGFVAARASGLRRSVDGMLHGVVAWGAAMLFFAIVTGSLTGGAVSGLLGLTTPPTASAGADVSTMGDLLSGLERGDRSATVTVLRDRFGLSQAQAEQIADRALAMTAGPGVAPPAASDDLNDAALTASAASAWLSVMILLSLAAGAGGGLLGARGARKRALPGHGHGEPRTVHTRTTQHDIPVAG
jgi:hypothetical protein